MIAEALLSRRRVLLTFAAALAVAGLHAFRIMPRELEPAVSSRLALVELELPGVDATELEQQLTVPTERELRAVPDVGEIRTLTRDGAAVLMVSIRPHDDEQAALGAVESALARVRERVAPQYLGLSGPRLRRPTREWPEMVAFVASKEGEGAPRQRADELAGALRVLSSVARVEEVGAPVERVVVTYDDRDLSEARLTPRELREYLNAQSFTAPGSYLTRNGSLLPIEAASRLVGVDALKSLEIRDPSDGATIALSRLLDVRREPMSPAIDAVSVDGRPAIALAVLRADDADLDDFQRDVAAACTDFEAAHAEVTAGVLIDQPAQVHEELSRFKVNLGQSFVAILVLLVLALGLRTGVAIAVVVPIVVLTSFVVLYLRGFHVDLVLLSSFVLVLGLLVDNHIVMAERIHALRQQGVAHAQAVRRALGELWAPLLAASATTVFGFLPVYLTDDAVGEYLRALFWVVLITLTTSLAFCLFITPLLLSSRDEPKPAESNGARPSLSAYRTALKALFKVPLPLLILAVLAAAWGVDHLTGSERVFFPAPSRPLWLLQIEHPHGTDLHATQRTVQSLDDLLRQETARPDAAVKRWSAFAGRSAPSFQPSLPVHRYEPHYAQVLIELDPARDPAALEGRLDEWIQARADVARCRVRPIRLGAQLDWPIAITIEGDDEALLPDAVARLTENLRELGCPIIGSDWDDPIHKLRVNPDRAALAERNLTVADLSLAMHAHLTGVPLFEIEDRGDRLPVFLRASSDRDDPVEALSDAYVYPVKGDASLLYEVAEIEEVSAPPVRVRRNGRPAATVIAEPKDIRDAYAVGQEAASWLPDLEKRYPDLDFQMGGAYEAEQRANHALTSETPWALLLVLLFLLVQSQSIRETLLILLCIPVAFTGVSIGMLVLDQPFSFMTLVGMTALAGLVVNNAIVLLASLRRRLEEHDENDGPLADALIDSACQRFRPILLTTLCAIISMVVLYQSGGPMWQPLATTIISGLLFSTVLVLFVLPALYAGARRVHRTAPPA